MPDRRTIKILSVLIAEDVRQEVTGLQTVVGIIAGRLIVASAPFVLPKMAFRIEFDSDEEFSSTYEFQLLNPAGQPMLRATGDIRVRHDLRNLFTGAWAPIHFTEVGRYAIQFCVEPARQREVASFLIVAAQQPVAAQGGVPANP